MKSTLILGVFLVLQITAVEEDKFSPEQLECIQELNIDRDHIVSVITDDSSRFLPEDDDVFNTFLHCYWLKSGFQNADGVVNFDNIINFVKDFTRDKFGGKATDTSPIGQDIAVKAADNCRDVAKGNAHGQTAVRAQNCIDKKMIELVQEEN